VATTIKQLLDQLEYSNNFQIIFRSNKLPDSPLDSSQIHYLNPIHPLAIHLIGRHEHEYLHSLSSEQQINLIHHLESNSAKLLVFEDGSNIPNPFLEQCDLSIITFSTNEKLTISSMLSELDELSLREVGLPGSFVVVFNQGIFITGKSGSGKSELLLSLVDKGHLWIADDLTLFRLCNHTKIVASASENLSSFIHVKNIGPINMDYNYGLGSRLKQHRLAACVHLSNNIIHTTNETNRLNPQKTTRILGQTFPELNVDSDSNHLTLLVENYARQLNLENWNYSAANNIKTIEIS